MKYSTENCEILNGLLWIARERTKVADQLGNEEDLLESDVTEYCIASWDKCWQDAKRADFLWIHRTRIGIGDN